MVAEYRKAVERRSHPRANHPSLAYTGGQEPIVHLEADLHQTVAWAEQNRLRWAFTLSNAGSYYFEDRCGRCQRH